MIGLIDVGSTFTKLTVVDLGGESLVCAVEAPTTVDTSVMYGFKNTLSMVEEAGVDSRAITGFFGCSSAAGGLQMVAIGLVPDLTAEAARMAALGAGAKVVGTFSYELSGEDIATIKKLKPDIILLAGGIDGGNRRVAVGNARQLARSGIEVPVVYAGNRAVADEVAGIFRRAGKKITVTENVLPALNRLNVDPAREAIAGIFINQIVEAKGLADLQAIMGRPLLPTPSAVLESCRLMAGGYGEEKGFGEIMLIDIGGATTDVYSAAAGLPTKAGVVPKGLPDPFLKRTVEGDLGVRYNARSILDLAGRDRVLANCGRPVGDIEGIVEKIVGDTSTVPADEMEYAVDRGLAVSAIQIAVQRHCGRLERYYTPDGEAFIQYGKDLSQIKTVLATGGVLLHSAEPRGILAGAVSNQGDPFVLTPASPDFYLDWLYIMYAVGLLSLIDRPKAFRIALKYLKPLQ